MLNATQIDAISKNSEIQDGQKLNFTLGDFEMKTDLLKWILSSGESSRGDDIIWLQSKLDRFAEKLCFNKSNGKNMETKQMRYDDKVSTQ